MCMRSCADQINGVVDDAASTPKKCLRVERKLRALAMRSMDQWIGPGENVQETTNFSLKHIENIINIGVSCRFSLKDQSIDLRINMDKMICCMWHDGHKANQLRLWIQ